MDAVDKDKDSDGALLAQEAAGLAFLDLGPKEEEEEEDLGDCEHGDGAAKADRSSSVEARSKEEGHEGTSAAFDSVGALDGTDSRESANERTLQQQIQKNTASNPSSNSSGNAQSGEVRSVSPRSFANRQAINNDMVGASATGDGGDGDGSSETNGSNELSISAQDSSVGTTRALRPSRKSAAKSKEVHGPNAITNLPGAVRVGVEGRAIPTDPGASVVGRYGGTSVQNLSVGTARALRPSRKSAAKSKEVHRPNLVSVQSDAVNSKSSGGEGHMISTLHYTTMNDDLASSNDGLILDDEARADIRMGVLNHVGIVGDDELKTKKVAGNESASEQPQDVSPISSRPGAVFVSGNGSVSHHTEDDLIWNDRDGTTVDQQHLSNINPLAAEDIVESGGIDGHGAPGQNGEKLTMETGNPQDAAPSQQGFMVSAFKVEDDEENQRGEGADNNNNNTGTDIPLANAKAVRNPFWSRKRLIKCSAIVILAVVAISLSLALTQPNSSRSGASDIESISPPTFAPTALPTDRPLAWIPMHDEPFRPSNVDSALPIDGDDDDFGSVVALSSDGLMVAASSPGRFVSTRLYRNEAWNELPLLNAVDFREIGNVTDAKGDDGVDDEITDDRFGHSLALSRDGAVLVVGVPDALNGTGQVLVFRLNANRTGYELLDPPLVDIEAHTRFGWSVSVSGDGTRVAVGTHDDLCFADVYSYDETARVWYTVGPGITCGSTGKKSKAKIDSTDWISGHTVQLNNDGNVLGIGTVNFAFVRPVVQDIGTMAAFRFNGSDWNPFGQGLKNRRSEDMFRNATESDSTRKPPPKKKVFAVVGYTFGHSMSFSDDGLTVAIGSPETYGQRNQEDEPTTTGIVALWDFDFDTRLWVARGTLNLAGASSNDLFGMSVSLSSDGSILAVGVPGSDAYSAGAGSVELYGDWSEEEGWMPKGEPIEGVSASSSTGHSVSLSGDGTIVAIGSPYNGPDPGFDDDDHHQGVVQVYAAGSELGAGGDIRLGIHVSSPGNAGYGLRWRIERLDTVSEGETVVASFVQYLGDDDGNATSLVGAESNGVYRLTLVGSQDDGGTSLSQGDVTIFETKVLEGSDGSDDQVVLAEMPIDMFTEATVVSSPVGVLGQEVMREEVRNEGATLLLVFDFDDSPQDLHWVVKSIWQYEEPDTGRPRQARKIVAYGPRTQYEPESQGQQHSELIDVSKVPPDASFTLTIVDVGWDGTEGSYRLYHGSQMLASTLLVDGVSFGRRVIHPFLLPSRR